MRPAGSYDFIPVAPGWLVVRTTCDQEGNVTARTVRDMVGWIGGEVDEAGDPTDEWHPATFDEALFPIRAYRENDYITVVRIPHEHQVHGFMPTNPVL